MRFHNPDNRTSNRLHYSVGPGTKPPTRELTALEIRTAFSSHSPPFCVSPYSWSPSDAAFPHSGGLPRSKHLTEGAPVVEPRFTARSPISTSDP